MYFSKHFEIIWSILQAGSSRSGRLSGMFAVRIPCDFPFIFLLLEAQFDI
jgi:hypothetical protein